MPYLLLYKLSTIVEMLIITTNHFQRDITTKGKNLKRFLKHVTFFQKFNVSVSKPNLAWGIITIPEVDEEKKVPQSNFDIWYWTAINLGKIIHYGVTSFSRI